MNQFKKRDLIGQKFGKLTVIGDAGKNKNNHYLSLVRCECGKEYVTRDTELICGRVKCCRNCSNPRITHGLTHTKLFNVWQGIRGRCYCKNDDTYRLYGGRGITMCDEWRNDFKTFYDWATSNGYEDGLSIDRIDVNGNYEPSNCRWADRYVQANNRRNNHVIYYLGERYTLRQLARKFDISEHCLYYRLSHNWDLEKALKLKPKIGRNQYEQITSF